MEAQARVAEMTCEDLEAYFYANYDTLIHRLCPDYREMLGDVVSAVPWHATSVVDLGCGTGTLLASLAARPGTLTRLIGIDLNPALIERAREKLPGLPDGAVELIRRDFLHGPLPVADVYVSSLVLHNLGVVDQMLLYRRIAGVARRFVQFEVVAGADEAEESERWEYLDWSMQQEGVADDERREAIGHMRDHDHPLTVAQHERIARSVGFTEFAVLKKAPGFAVFRADRT